MENTFKSSVFGGFNRDDVIRYIEKTSLESKQQIEALEQESDGLCRENAELRDKLAAADALDAATRERLQAMIAACRGHCEQVLSTLGATCESVSNELKRADAAVAQLPEAFTTLEGQLDELKKLEQ